MTYYNTDSTSDMRMKRGLDLLENKGKSIIENEDGSFLVPSQQTHGKSYEVRLLAGTTWACCCPDFEFRHIEACKHIFAVKMFIAAKVYIKNEPKPKVFASDAIPCDRCGSIRVIHYGKSGRKQAYLCKDCKRKFTQKSLLDRARFSPELISLILDLYFSGLSVRKVARNVNDHFDQKIDSSTIYRWIQKYVPVVSEYVKTLTPELSNTWHADELFVKMKGGKPDKMKQNIAYLWNIMDRRTRFLLASKLSEDRDSIGAIAAFKEAIQSAQGIAPENVFTDAHKSYRQGIKALEMAGTPNHIANCGVGKPHATNNRIERLNGTLRERVKVQRGWKSKKSALAEGMRIQYNFVKPHQALKGETPAQAAELQVKGWNELLKAGIKLRGDATR